jgi:hypothetical protein
MPRRIDTSGAGADQLRRTPGMARTSGCERLSTKFCRSPIRQALVLLGFLALSACVTPKMHTEAQLNQIATGCGLALGELIQDESEKKLLLMIRQGASAEQRVCVAKWARRHGLKMVFVDNIQFPEG